MVDYATVLTRDDPRILEIFDVETETLDSGSTLIDDPFPKLGELRAAAPVHQGTLGHLMGYEGYHFDHHVDGFPTWTALSFKAVSKGLIDNKTFSSRAYHVIGQAKMLGDTILSKWGGDHRRYRAPIQPLFSPEFAQSWWDERIIRETVDILISEIEKKERSNLFIDLCARMPVNVVSGAFGLDPEDIITFRVGLLGMMRHGATPQERRAAMEQVHAILAGVITDRRSRPGNDIISKLVAAELKQEDGSSRPFTDREIIDHCILIVLAGGGTTWRQLGITIFALLNHPEQMEDLRADRSLAPQVILETARWHPTDLIFPRMIEEDTELEGVALPKGHMLHLCLGSANRDPERWENPDQFDIHRPVQRALAFGGGPHSCLGQHVSRQEMVVALDAILDRLPNLRWDPEAPPPKIIGDLFARGPNGLPVIFG